MGSTPPAAALEEGRCQTFPPWTKVSWSLASPESPPGSPRCWPGTGSSEGRAGTATMAGTSTTTTAGTSTALTPAGPADGEVSGSGK